MIAIGLLLVRMLGDCFKSRLSWIAVTRNPTVKWLARQITEAFPWDRAEKNTRASNVLLACLATPSPTRGEALLDLVHQGMSQSPLAQFGKVFKYQGLP